MQRAARRAKMANLRTAGKSVGNDDRVGRRIVDRRKQSPRANCLRYLEMRAVVAERARHPAASRLEYLEVRARRARQQCNLAADSRERLLMAVPLHESPSANLWRRIVRRFASKEFVQEERLCRDRLRARIARKQ